MSQPEYTTGYKHGFTDALRDIEAKGDVPPEFLEQQKGNGEDKEGEEDENEDEE